MKVAIYCRVSTNEQDAKLQISECNKFAKNRGFEIYNTYVENLSGFKDIKRDKYTEVKNLARKGIIKGVIVWAIDRWVRNRNTLLEDITVLKSYDCKLYSVKEEYIDAINIDGAIGKTIKDFLIGLMGSLAEMESQRKSERIKLAVRKKEGDKTRSYKGKKWGRKSIPLQTQTKILQLYSEGISIRKIADQVKTYDKHGNAKNISKSVVHKTIQENNAKKLLISDSPQID